MVPWVPKTVPKAVSIQEEPVLCLQRLSLKQVKCRGHHRHCFFGASPFFGRVSAQLAPEKCFTLLLQRLENLSKIDDNVQESIKNAPKIHPGRPSGALLGSGGTLGPPGTENSPKSGFVTISPPPPPQGYFLSQNLKMERLGTFLGDFLGGL